MRAEITHQLGRNRELRLEHGPTTYLALVDLDSYPEFAGEKTDYLDLLAHLTRQTEALTAVMCEVAEMPLRLKLVLVESQVEAERLEHSGHRMVFSGRVRTSGRLCLAGQERLLDSARHRRPRLTRATRLLSDQRPQVLLVPSGVYEVSIFTAARRWAGVEASPEAPHYTLVLRHFPHPPPRVAPVRLGSLIPGRI